MLMVSRSRCSSDDTLSYRATRSVSSLSVTPAILHQGVGRRHERVSSRSRDRGVEATVLVEQSKPIAKIMHRQATLPVVKIAFMEMVNLTGVVSGGESEALEFKKSTAQLKPAGETLCAFLNADGGRVVVGVTPQGKVIGQHVSDSTRQDIAAMLYKFEPPPFIEVEYVPLLDSDRKVIVLRAASARDARPFTFDGRPYHRVETTTSVMPQEMYERLLLERTRNRHRWELETTSTVTVDDLDQEQILRTARIGVNAGRLPESAGTDPTDILKRLGLLDKQGTLLNAAVVLYETQFFPEYPQCQLRMAVFKGTDKTEFIDNRQINGNGFELLVESMSFLRRHLPVAGRVQPGLFERIEEPLFPPVALKEALVNALCHRDYSRPGGSVSLAIYDDRLEIWNDGTLPADLTAWRTSSVTISPSLATLS